MDKYTEQRIKDTARIVDVVGDYVELRKRGIEWEGLCPFHADRHLGSFKVSESKNICTCFSCGKTYDPAGFIMAIENCDYPTALRILAKRYGIAIEGEAPIETKPVKPRPKPEPLQLLTIDNSIVLATLGRDRHNTLRDWLTSLPWSDEQRRRLSSTLWLYALGTWTDGRAVFWQTDDHSRVRTGKLMAYNPDGHRIKTENPGWVHNFVGYDRKRYTYETCLFGLHLIRRYPQAAIHIVESEKTAIVCAIAYGHLERDLWLACGGLEQLKARMLQPLIDEKRRIYLWPDKDGEAKWRKFADRIEYDQLAIYTRHLKNSWVPADGPKADIADIIVRTLSEPKEQLAERMTKRNPELDNLINELGAQIINL